ncbi:MAG: glycoside hydrolase family 97 N-terminal domain-containing protein, partial [Bacteroidota bacterium]
MLLRSSLLCLMATATWLLSCQSEADPTAIVSPNGQNRIEFRLSPEGAPSYLVNHGEEIIIEPSTMGFEFQVQAPLQAGLKILGTQQRTGDETWEMPWGEQREVRNHYRELEVQLAEQAAPNRKLNVRFRAYDDGVAFRYEFLPQEGVDTLIIMDEHTEFQLTGDHTAWWIPGDWDIYEHKYNTSKVSEIDALAKRGNADLASTTIPENAVNTPVTMRAASGTHLSFHEANLTDYAGMTLKVDTETHKLTSELVGSDLRGFQVKRALPFHTPWRTIQIADEAADLIESKLIVNLNEPNKLGDMSWFTPMKYVGIWWEMHLGVSTWDMEATQDMNTFATLGKEQTSSKHGATTENTKRYI